MCPLSERGTATNRKGLRADTAFSLTTAVNEDDNTASLALAMEVAWYFELDADQARAIAAQVGKAVSRWRGEAARHGLTKPEIERMASAFEHQDLEMARDG